MRTDAKYDLPDDVIEHVVAVLNRAHAADPEAMEKLLATRVPCNRKLADDPTIQVAQRGSGFQAHLLGIINGICGANEMGYGPIAAKYGDRLEGFERTGPPDRGRE